MRDYIPDLTERYPEGFGGVDMYEPRDPEYEFWKAVEDIVQSGEDIVEEPIEEEPKQSAWEELIAIMNSEE